MITLPSVQPFAKPAPAFARAAIPGRTNQAHNTETVTFGAQGKHRPGHLPKKWRVQKAWHAIRKWGRNVLQTVEIALDKIRLGVGILAGLLAFLPMPDCVRGYVESMYLFGEIKTSNVSMIKNEALRKRISDQHFSMAQYQQPLQKAGMPFRPGRDNIRINAWHIKAPAGKPTVILHHGRRFNNSHQEGFLQALVDRGYGVLVYDYPGFGKSEGIPTEQGLYNSGLATSLYAKDELGIPFENQIHMGNSLGSVVAASTVKRLNQLHHQPKALVLISTFPTTKELFNCQLNNIWPGLKRIFNADRIHLRLDALEKLRGIGKTPLLIMQGQEDQVTPISMVRNMIGEARQSTFKEFKPLPKAGHSLVLADYKPIANQTASFLAALEKSNKAESD